MNHMLATQGIRISSNSDHHSFGHWKFSINILTRSLRVRKYDKYCLFVVVDFAFLHGFIQGRRGH